MKSRSSIWDAPTLHDALRTYGEARTLALLVEAFHATERPADGTDRTPCGSGASALDADLETSGR